MNSQQLTFSDVATVHRIKSLTRNQRKIISLVNLQLTQSDIAAKLGYSRAYINQVIKRLESLGLVKRLSTQPLREGIRQYNLFYEVCPDVKIPGAIFTPYRAHHFIRKFQIIRQSAPTTLDKRTSYSKSHPMRGWESHKFWYSGKAGLPSVTIDVNPKSIMVYVDKGQKIAARSAEEAKQIGWYAVFKAKDNFIEEQSRFGIELEIERAGQQIGKVHMGLEGSEDGPMAPIKQAQDLISKERVMNVKHPVWFDRSSGEGKLELEMFEDHPQLTPAETTINTIADLPATIKAAMPEAMKEFEKSFAPLTSEIHMVMAHIQSGQSVQNQINQLVVLVAQLVKDNHDLKERLEKRGG